MKITERVFYWGTVALLVVTAATLLAAIVFVFAVSAQ